MKKILFITLIFFNFSINAFAITLKASHQFPGGKGDARDEMVQILAREVEKANVGVKIQVYPGQSLYKALEQYPALKNGDLDISAVPLDYASGFHPIYSATLMPGLIINHEHARKINKSSFMKEIENTLYKDDIIVISHAWLSGGFGSTKNCITNPESAKGQVTRAAGKMFEAMLVGAGSSISSAPSSDVYNSLLNGNLTAVNTSSESFVSFKMYEVLRCVTIPGDYALWFMYEPILMSKKSFDKLNDKQKRVLLEAGQKAEEYMSKASAGLDANMERVFREKGVQIARLNQSDYLSWLRIAKITSYKIFTERVSGGDRLIAKALEVDSTTYTKKDEPQKRYDEKNNKPQETKRNSDNTNIKAASGTGFFINKTGHLITNHHVIDQCNLVNAYYKGDAKPLKLLASDRKNDLAILKAELRPDDTFPVSKDDAILLEEIYVAGYPFGKSVSGSVKVTKGVVSSLSGIGNNYSNIQVDASLQPGNSGGPILNKKGNVVAVAQAKLDYKKVLEAFNTIPENTNFGVKSSTLNQFLNANKIISDSPKSGEMSIKDIADKIEKATVYLDCWMTADKIEELKSKRAFFTEN